MAAKDWWNRFLYHQKKIFPHGRYSSVRPVRIAVLDTGIDITNPFFTTSWLQSGGKYRDFIDEAAATRLEIGRGYDESHVSAILNAVPEQSPSTARDQCGHGTAVAGILLQLVPDATLHVARVLEEDQERYDVGAAVRRVALVCMIFSSRTISSSFRTLTWGADHLVARRFYSRHRCGRSRSFLSQ